MWKSILILVTAAFSVVSACDADACTRTQGYWKNHVETWPSAYRDVSFCEALNCSCDDALGAASLIDVFQTPPAGYTYIALAHQWIAATLNLEVGACIDDAARDAYDEARDALCAREVNVSALNDALTAFNEGAAGAAHCDDIPRVCVDCEVGDCGCAYTQGAWEQKFGEDGAANNGFCVWPTLPRNSCVALDWLSASELSEATPLCNTTWLGALQTPPQGEKWAILAQQWVAAVLNVLNGACWSCVDDGACEDILETLEESYARLMACESIGNAEWEFEWESAHELLTDFNEGSVGPGHCAEDLGRCCAKCGVVPERATRELAQRLDRYVAEHYEIDTAGMHSRAILIAALYFI